MFWRRTSEGQGEVSQKTRNFRANISRTLVIPAADSAHPPSLSPLLSLRTRLLASNDWLPRPGSQAGGQVSTAAFCCCCCFARAALAGNRAKQALWLEVPAAWEPGSSPSQSQSPSRIHHIGIGSERRGDGPSLPSSLPRRLLRLAVATSLLGAVGLKRRRVRGLSKRGIATDGGAFQEGADEL